MRLGLLAFVLTGVLLVACDDDSDSSSTPTPTISPVVSQTVASSTPASATPIAREPVIGPDAPFPDDIAVIIETGCWQCDGTATGLVRIYRDPSGALRIDRLSDNIGNFIGFAASLDGSRLTATICVSGVCDGFNQPTPPPVFATVMSEDGGITWAPLSVDGGVAAILRDRLIMRRRIQGDVDQWRYVEHPSGVELARPHLSGPDDWPFAVSSDEVRWLAADGRALIYEDATVGYILDQDGAAGLEKDARIYEARLHEGNTLFLYIFPGDNVGKSYVALSQTNDWRITSLVEIEGGFRLGPALDDDTVLANVTLPGTFEFLPAFVDLDSATIRPIREPFATADGFARGRNYVLGVMNGPFARVVSPGDCLNIREDAALDSPVLLCAADGVLLRDAGKTRIDGARTWRSVVTTGGAAGWADAAFLEVR